MRDAGLVEAAGENQINVNAPGGIQRFDVEDGLQEIVGHFFVSRMTPDACFARFFLPRSHDPVTLTLQFSCEGFSSRSWQASIKIDKTVRFLALG